jgi:hypothetical protein
VKVRHSTISEIIKRTVGRTIVGLEQPEFGVAIKLEDGSALLIGIQDDGDGAEIALFFASPPSVKHSDA